MVILLALVIILAVLIALADNSEKPISDTTEEKPFDWAEVAAEAGYDNRHDWERAEEESLILFIGSALVTLMFIVILIIVIFKYA